MKKSTDAPLQPAVKVRRAPAAHLVDDKLPRRAVGLLGGVHARVGAPERAHRLGDDAPKAVEEPPTHDVDGGFVQLADLAEPVRVI
jgi:hypothetical protein